MLRADDLSTDEKWRTAITLLLMGALFVPLIVGYDFFFPYVVPRNVFFRVAVEAAVVGAHNVRERLPISPPA